MSVSGVEESLDSRYTFGADNQSVRGCSSMVELQLPKLVARVRFPSPAPCDVSGRI